MSERFPTCETTFDPAGVHVRRLGYDEPPRYGWLTTLCGRNAFNDSPHIPTSAATCRDCLAALRTYSIANPSDEETA